MSAPSERFQRLTLDDGMPRSQHVESRRNGRRYDLASLSSSQHDSAADGLRSDQLRLLPILSRAVYPEEGYLGFNVSERHVIRIPVPEDSEGEQAGQQARCDCPTFTRDRVCPHITWLYDGVQEAFNSPHGRSKPDPVTEDGLQRFFAHLATPLSSTSNAPPITETINRQQHPVQTPEQIDQNVLDTLAIFERSFAPDESATRKKPRREGDSSPEGARSNVQELKTCLDLDRAEFFANTPAADASITDMIIPGDLLESLKGLLRHSRVLCESVNHVLDDRYKAKDFVNRLRYNFDEWYSLWRQYRNDNRRTVAPLHIQQFANKVRLIIGNLREYDVGIRTVPTSYYDDAIDLAISILGKLCGAELEYVTSTFVARESTPRPSSYATVEATNIDIFKDHTRQAKQGLSDEARDRNLFYNLIVSPPTGSPRLIEEIARLLTQWEEHLTEDHIDNIRIVGRTMSEELEQDGSVDRATAVSCLHPLQLLVRTHGSQRS